MKYILYLLGLTIAVNADAQTAMQHTPGGASYQIFTRNTGEKIKLNDVITFQFIQKTGKDSVLFSTYAAGHPVQAQVKASQNVGDLMEIFPLLTGNDSAYVTVPADSVFKGHEDQRPAFLPKGSSLNFTLKILKVQSLDQAIADIKAAEVTSANKYIKDHKLILTATPSGLRYAITKPSLGRKPLKGDTVLVNYIGRATDDRVFDTSLEDVAKSAGLNQPGRTYQPLQVVVGTGGVIPGWEEGLLLLNEGSRAIFVVPSHLGYGEQGMGDIQPFSTLIFDIELVKIKPAKHPAATATRSAAKKKVRHIVHKKKAVPKKTTKPQA
jgi:FKBP-type peptidyl-prolyl cis-trans isomerase FkpA